MLPTLLYYSMSNSEEILSKQALSEKIGQRIKQIRLSKGVSQSELARLCNKDRQHIELIENSKLNANTYTVYLISNALGVRLSDFFDWDTDL